MANDKTWGTRVSDELNERLDKRTGGNKREWLERMLALDEAQSVRDFAPDYGPDLKEVEIHTARIFEAVSNMVQRAVYLKDDAVHELNGKLESRDTIISNLQTSINQLQERLSQSEEATKLHTTEKEEVTGQLEELRASNATNQDLIKEYKEKVDTLSSLVNEYKGYAAENLELKKAHVEEKEKMKEVYAEKESRMVSSLEDLKASAHDQEALIKQLQTKLNTAIDDHKSEIENLKANHVNQLTQLTDRKELEKERAILEIERKYQAKLEAIQDQYNEKITRLYEKLDRNDDKGKEQTDK
jgi:chromosome segregation ATPase